MVTTLRWGRSHHFMCITIWQQRCAFCKTFSGHTVAITITEPILLLALALNLLYIFLLMSKKIKRSTCVCLEQHRKSFLKNKSSNLPEVVNIFFFWKNRYYAWNERISKNNLLMTAYKHWGGIFLHNSCLEYLEVKAIVTSLWHSKWFVLTIVM